MSEIDLVIDGDKAFANGELQGIELRHNDLYFYKYAQTDIERAFLRNAYEKLFELEDSGFTPKPIDIRGSNSSTEIIVEYLGKSEPVTDEIAFRRNCALLLWTLKKHNIRHGDITTKNIIVKDNKPMLIDFHQSKFDHEPGPDKRPEGDAHWLWKSALELSPDTSRHIRKWQAIRPFVQNDIVDLGCAEGDYCLFAMAENDNRHVHGYDNNCDNIEFAMNHWRYEQNADRKPLFGCLDIVDELVAFHNDDAVFLLSVFPYLVNQHGLDRTVRFIRKLMEANQLFFETQLHGDGPGPEFFQTDNDVYKFLKQYGKVEKLVTIPVHGRDSSRTVWRVT